MSLTGFRMITNGTDNDVDAPLGRSIPINASGRANYSSSDSVSSIRTLTRSTTTKISGHSVRTARDTQTAGAFKPMRLLSSRTDDSPNPQTMTALEFGTVCEAEHITPTGEAESSLLELSGCEECGKPVYRRCPNCDAPIPIRSDSESPETNGQWQVDEFCRDCGEVYPWGPGRIGQFYHRLVSGWTDEQVPTPSGEVFGSGVERYLSQTKYGDELIDYTRDGDSCYRNRLWFPALMMYIHAIEWAAITFLEDQASLDIIEKEREGVDYYLTGGERSIVEALREHDDVDPRTVTVIKSMNRLERRWVAHQKSGNTDRGDLDAVQGRLKILVESLFGTQTEDPGPDETAMESFFEERRGD